MAGPLRKPRPPVEKNTNLLKHFDYINREFFGGHVCGGIGWRRLPFPKSDDQCTTLGYCNFTERFISVNEVLDDARVPVWYLRFIIYHEMLHLNLGPTPGGCKNMHNDLFLSYEQKHPDYKRAIDFDEKRMPHIIASWRRWREWKKTQPKKSRIRAAARSVKK
jgi:hypothetical protein